MGGEELSQRYQQDLEKEILELCGKFFVFFCNDRIKSRLVFLRKL